MNLGTIFTRRRSRKTSVTDGAFAWKPLSRLSSPAICRVEQAKAGARTSYLADGSLRSSEMRITQSNWTTVVDPYQLLAYPELLVR